MTKNKKLKLKKGSNVFYPSHGAGWVTGIREIEFGGEEKTYYDFAFVNKKLTISTPVENSSSLGIREIESKKTINDSLKELKKTPSKKAKKASDYSQLIDIIQELDKTGELENFITILQYCNQEKKIREKEGRLIPVSINKHVNMTVDHLVCELSLAEDIEYDKASKKFEKLTGMTVKEKYL